MKKTVFLMLALMCAGTLLAQVRTTRSVSVKRTRIQTEYQYFVRFGGGALDLDRYENDRGQRSTLPFGGVFSWGFRKPFNNSTLAVYWGMEYGLAPYSTAYLSYYDKTEFLTIYTSDGQQHRIPKGDYGDRPYVSVYSHALNARPLMIGLDYKVAPDISVDLHLGLGINATFFGRYVYDLGDSYGTKHGDGSFLLRKNNGGNRRLYCDLQLGLGVWWRNLNLEVTAVAVPRNMRMDVDVPYEYVTYDQYGHNPQNYTSSITLLGGTSFAFQLMARLGISF